MGKGTNGACPLTEENLTQLDDLYKLVTPTREEEKSFADELQASAEHLARYVEGSDKEVLGTTYKDLRAIVEQIQECGYFDQQAAAEEDEEVAEESKEVEEGESEESAQGAEEEQPDEEFPCEAEAAPVAEGEQNESHESMPS